MDSADAKSPFGKACQDGSMKHAQPVRVQGNRHILIPPGFGQQRREFHPICH